MDQDEFDLQIKQDFIAEALEMLGWVEDQFLIFEQNPTDSRVVDEIFRMAHTVKGSAMTCGFTRLGEFAHVMETLLVKIREGSHTPDSDTVDVLLRSNDTLRIYLELLRSNFNAVLDTQAMKDDLLYFIGDDVKSTKAAPAMSFGFFDDDEVAAAPPAMAFGFFDDEEEPAKAPAPALDLGPSTPKPILTIAMGDYDMRTKALQELSFLNLKAYLDLSASPTEAGIKACLESLEEALIHLNTLREA